VKELRSSEEAVSAVIGARAIERLRGQRVLLAGATGKNGRRILEQLLALGVPVRAMSRKAVAVYGDDASQTVGNPQWVRADVTQAATLGSAVAGIDVIISAVATARPFGGNRPERVDFEGTLNLIAAAKSAGVRRFVIITSSVSGKRGGLLNLLAGNVLVWKGAAEECLVRSGLEYVIVGPAWINDEPGGVRPVELMARRDYRRGMAITRTDLASVVIGCAAEPDAANRAFTAINGAAAEALPWQSRLPALPPL